MSIYQAILKIERNVELVELHTGHIFIRYEIKI